MATIGEPQMAVDNLKVSELPERVMGFLGVDPDVYINGPVQRGGGNDANLIRLKGTGFIGNAVANLKMLAKRAPEILTKYRRWRAQNTQ